MEFLDNSGHIFSLTSYNENPIGYEYDENPYVFYMNDNNQYRLSINNYYIRTIYALYPISKEFNLDKFEIDIYFNNTNIYKLISPIKFQENISNLKDLSDSIEFDLDDSDIIKTSLNKDDIYCIETTDVVNNIEYNYYLIPIYVLSYCTEEGTWLSNLMIHINDNEYHTYCPITIGAVYVDEYEELIINGKNMGIILPKDIIKSLYSESIYNNEFNLEIYNKKLKEYLLNYTGIRSELGNYNSVINSLKWFGYGDKIILSKLIKTDNDIMNQYVRDYFYTNNDILKSFNKFKNDSLVSLIMMTNKELDETYDLDLEETNSFIGEGKPKLYSLLDNYEKVKINNHNLPINNDTDKYFYWKPYFDFGFNELCIKLSLLKYFFKKYFLPIHLNVHSSSLGERVFMNDIKMTSHTSIGMSSPVIYLGKDEGEVEFTGNGIHYYTKQIHYVDDYFNEFDSLYMEHNYNDVFYELNDTCISIPIKFKSNRIYNCILILERYDETLYESHFNFFNENDSYKNFIIYPKKFNIKNYIESKGFEYWVNSEFTIKLCVNNRWYEYSFKTKISKPIIDFGKLKYKYKFDNIQDLLGYDLKNDKLQHSLLMINTKDEKYNLDNNYIVNKTIKYNFENLYNLYHLDDTKSVIFPVDSNIELYNSVISLGNYSKFSQIESITNENVNFNVYMHNHKLAEVNNINYDINFYKVLKYHLENNLQYIDGELINRQFYTYFNYYSVIKPNDVRIPLYFKETKNKLFGFNVYMRNDSGYYVKYLVRYNKNNELSLYDENDNYICKWTNNLNVYLKYEVYIHKDLIGQPLRIRNTYLSSLSSNLLYAYNNQLFILRETDNNSNVYEILNKDYALLSEEYNDDIFGLLMESYDFEYDDINKRYFRTYYDENNKLITETYELCDKLFQDVTEIYSNYNYSPNIIRSDRFLNIIHLFGVYGRYYKLNNILSFNPDTDINVNGINFKYVNKYLDEYTDEELSLIEENNVSLTNVYSDKFYISGHILRDIVDADTRYPDVYGLYWEHYLKDENGKPYLNLKYDKDYEAYDNYGLYIKREFDETKNICNLFELDNDYFTEDEAIEYNNSLPDAIQLGEFKIPATDGKQGILYTYEEILEYNSKLPGAVKANDIDYPKNTGIHKEYITSEDHYYYNSNSYTDLAEFRFETIEDFKEGKYNEEYIPKDFYGELLFTEIDGEHIYQWIDTHFYDDNMQAHKYDLEYKVFVKLNNNEDLVPITPGIIYNNEYEYLIVKFAYKKIYLVKNKYYSLGDYLVKKLGATKENGKYIINGKEVNIVYSTDENYQEYNMLLPGAYTLDTPVTYTQQECDDYNNSKKLDPGDPGYRYTERTASTYNSRNGFRKGSYNYVYTQEELNLYHTNNNLHPGDNGYIFTDETARIYNEEHGYIYGDPEYISITAIVINTFKGYGQWILKYYNRFNAPSEDLINTTYYELIVVSEEEVYEHNKSLPNAKDYVEGYPNSLVAAYYDEFGNRTAINIIKVSDIKRYVDTFNQEIKIQNPSGYWYNIDNGKIQDLPSAFNELKRYWFNENEDNTVGDTLEEIRNSLEIYKQKLEKLKSYDKDGNLKILPEYGLNQKDNIELRYRYRNYLSKYITGLKGRFKIEWSYVDANGNIDISDTLDESIKIFNLCVCVTNQDDSIKIYSTNKEEFELTGNEKEVVVYFRLNTTDKRGEITPFYIKPKLISVTESNERLKYNYKESGNEVKVSLGNKTYLYGDNTSEHIINLYKMFFENTWNIYDVYPEEFSDIEYKLKTKLMHKVYDKNQNIKIKNDDLYDFYLMHDNEYWYGLYISKYTCDNIDLRSIKINNDDKLKYLNNTILMKYERSAKEFLINRMEYISANGVNHFMNNDIICAYLINNDRLPIKIDVSSKWRIAPISLGMDKTSDFESNAEMTIISMPYNDNKYQSGYYKATVRYSLDRDLQHQFKDTATFKVN